MKFLLALWLPSLGLVVASVVIGAVDLKSPAAPIAMLLGLIGIGIANRCSKIYIRTRIRARAWRDARKRG